MPADIGGVVGQRAQGKGIVVAVAGLVYQVSHKIARADVVRQVGEQRVAKWIIAHVLDNGSAVGVGFGIKQFFGSGAGVTPFQGWHQTALPGRVDICLVGEHGVCRRRAGGESQQHGQQQKVKAKHERIR